MRYFALACDYDGTIASAGVVDAQTLVALARLRASGRKLILVTGRELDDLLHVFPHVTLFDLVVAENGALLYWPATRAERALGEPPPEAFITALRQRGVTPLSCGRVIVATWHPCETIVVEVIRDLGLELADRPAFFKSLLPRLQELRARTGHPHWIVVDEVHHLLPASLESAALLWPQNMYGMMMLTVQPQHVAKDVLALADVLITIGEAPHETLGHFSATLGLPPPPLVTRTLEQGHAIVWARHEPTPPVQLCIVPPRAEHQRHVRRYMAGELGTDISFYFRGPEGKLNLRAQNLMVFMQLAEGVDDATWLHHLSQGDYARWFHDVMKDTGLAEETLEIGKRHDLSAGESRTLVKQAIEKRYTAPA